MSIATPSRLDAAEIKRQAAGRWREILPATTGISTELLDGRNHPCPACGGTDRFAVFNDFAETGGVICRGCHETGNGDGLAAVQHFAGVDFPGAVRLVAEYLGMAEPSRSGVPASRNSQVASTKPRETRDSGGFVDVDGKTFLNCEALVERLFPGAIEVYRYQHRTGADAGAAIRLADPKRGKTFRQVALLANGKWSPEAMPAPRPLYRAPAVNEAEGVVLIVEGEKDVHTAESIGMVATTCIGGAQAASKSDWSLLAGRDVIVVPDNDRAGREFAEAVTAKLSEVQPRPRVRLLEIERLMGGAAMPDKGDLTDWVESHGDAAEPEVIAENLVGLIGKAKVFELPEIDPPTRWRPFPTEALPEIARHFTERGAGAIGCDASYLAVPLLSVCAALIGASRVVRLKFGWQEQAVVWTAIVGESGTQKTPAFRACLAWLWQTQTDAYREHQDLLDQYDHDKQQYERDLAAWKKGKLPGSEPVPPTEPTEQRHVVNDTTVEALVRVLKSNPRGVLSATDELAGWFASFDKYKGGKAGGDVAAWLSMFNAGPIRVDRATSRSLYVPTACVSVTGGVQPGILRRVLSDEHRESGLAARVLMVCPPRQPKRWSESEMPEATEQRMHDAFARLAQLQPESSDEIEEKPVVVTLAPQAKSEFIRFVNDHGTEAESLSGDLAAAWSKLEAYAARFALVLHCLRLADDDLTVDADDNVIDIDTMRSALTIVAWFKHETRRVYGMFAESASAKSSRELAEWIASKGGDLSVKDIQAGRRNLKTATDAEKAVAALAEAGYGETYHTQSGDQGGRPSQRFRLHSQKASTSTKPRGTAVSGGFVDAETPNNHETAFDAWGAA